MTRIFTENFTGGSPGDPVTTANSAFTTSAAANWVFSTAQLTTTIGRTQSALATSTAAPSVSVAPLASTATPWMRFALRVATRPGATATMASFRAGATVLCDLQMLTTGQIRLRNGAGTAVVTAGSSVLPLNTDCLIEWRYDGTLGQQQVRIFRGTNINGATPDYDSGTIATTAAGAADGFALGVSGSDTASMYFGAVAVDNANWVGPPLRLLALTGSGALALSGTSAIAGTAARTGSGTLAFSGTPQIQGQLALAGTGSLLLEGPPPPPLSPISVWTGTTWAPVDPLVWNGTSWQLTTAKALAGSGGGGGPVAPGSYPSTYLPTY